MSTEDDSASEGKRRMILSVSKELLTNLFVHGTGMIAVDADPLPPDSRIVSVRHNPFVNHELEFLIESKSFPLTFPGGLYPNVKSPTYRRIYPA